MVRYIRYSTSGLQVSQYRSSDFHSGVCSDCGPLDFDSVYTENGWQCLEEHAAFIFIVESTLKASCSSEMYKYVSTSKTNRLKPEEGGIVLLRNVGIRLQDYTVLQLRRPKFVSLLNCCCLPSTMILGSDSHGYHDHVLLSDGSGSLQN
jgi:hypothetical protein